MQINEYKIYHTEESKNFTFTKEDRQVVVFPLLFTNENYEIAKDVINAVAAFIKEDPNIEKFDVHIIMSPISYAILVSEVGYKLKND